MDPKWSKHILRRSRKHPKSTPKYFLRRYGWIHRVWFNDVGCLLSNSIIFGTTRAATIFFCRHEWTLVQPKHNKSGHEWTQQSVECLVDPKYYSSIPHALLDNNISIFADSTKSAHRSAPLNPGTKKNTRNFSVFGACDWPLEALASLAASRSSRLLLPGVSAFRPDNVRSWWDRTTWSRVFRL